MNLFLSLVFLIVSCSAISTPSGSSRFDLALMAWSSKNEEVLEKNWAPHYPKNVLRITYGGNPQMPQVILEKSHLATWQELIVWLGDQNLSVAELKQKLPANDWKKFSWLETHQDHISSYHTFYSDSRQVYFTTHDESVGYLHFNALPSKTSLKGLIF